MKHPSYQELKAALAEGDDMDRVKLKERCWACGRKMRHTEDNYCYGCKHHVCQSCSDRYIHCGRWVGGHNHWQSPRLARGGRGRG